MIYRGKIGLRARNFFILQVGDYAVGSQAAIASQKKENKSAGREFEIAKQSIVYLFPLKVTPRQGNPPQQVE